MGESRCLFRCANCKQRLKLYVTRISYQSSAIHSDSISNNWNNWTAGTLNLFHFQYDWILTGQHDRQDERLTGQIHNQSGHCPLTGRYFEPWIQAPSRFINRQQRRLLSDWSIHTLVPRFIAPRATENLINKHGCRREDFYLSLLDHLFYSFV